jgi:tRNA(fMet)-specific endonuclease VapC
VDTNIVSYLFKRDSRAALYAPHLLNRELAIAMMTVAELFQWAAMRNWGKPRVRRLEQHLERYTVSHTCFLLASIASRAARLVL